MNSLFREYMLIFICCSKVVLTWDKSDLFTKKNLMQVISSNHIFVHIKIFWLRFLKHAFSLKRKHREIMFSFIWCLQSPKDQIFGSKKYHCDYTPLPNIPVFKSLVKWHNIFIQTNVNVKSPEKRLWLLQSSHGRAFQMNP